MFGKISEEAGVRRGIAALETLIPPSASPARYPPTHLGGGLAVPDQGLYWERTNLGWGGGIGGPPPKGGGEAEGRDESLTALFRCWPPGVAPVCRPGCCWLRAQNLRGWEDGSETRPSPCNSGVNPEVSRKQLLLLESARA